VTYFDIELWIEKGYVEVLIYKKSIIVKLKKLKIVHFRRLNDDEI